jgi:hypothetical protein
MEGDRVRDSGRNKEMKGETEMELERYTERGKERQREGMGQRGKNRGEEERSVTGKRRGGGSISERGGRKRWRGTQTQWERDGMESERELETNTET